MIIKSVWNCFELIKESFGFFSDCCVFAVCLLPVQRWAGRRRADSRVCGRPDSPAPPPASCGCGWSPAARGWCRGSWCSRGNWTCWGSERRDPERRASPPRAFLERQTVRHKSQTFLSKVFVWVQVCLSSAASLLLPPTYRGASPVTSWLRPWLSRVVGSPPSTDRFTMRLKVTSSTVWNCPSLTVSVLLVEYMTHTFRIKFRMKCRNLAPGKNDKERR